MARASSLSRVAEARGIHDLAASGSAAPGPLPEPTLPADGLPKRLLQTFLTKSARVGTISRLRHAVVFAPNGPQRTGQGRRPRATTLSQYRLNGRAPCVVWAPQRGENSPAQGNALGALVRAIHPALKGRNSARHTRLSRRASSGRATSGRGGLLGTKLLRALPRAGGSDAPSARGRPCVLRGRRWAHSRCQLRCRHFKEMPCARAFACRRGVNFRRARRGANPGMRRGGQFGDSTF